jgi:hypothetical protein
MWLLILLAGVAQAPTGPVGRRCPIVSGLVDKGTVAAGLEQQETACEAEEILQGAGYRARERVGALANAWHESRWFPEAGKRKRAVGFWQLHEDGLGNGMSVAERENIDLSTYKVLEAYDPDERLPSRAPASEHATQFCLEVMRPKDKRARAIERARTAARWERALAI